MEGSLALSSLSSTPFSWDFSLEKLRGLCWTAWSGRMFPFPSFMPELPKLFLGLKKIEKEIWAWELPIKTNREKRTFWELFWDGKIFDFRFWGSCFQRDFFFAINNWSFFFYNLFNNFFSNFIIPNEHVRSTNKLAFIKPLVKKESKLLNSVFNPFMWGVLKSLSSKNNHSPGLVEWVLLLRSYSLVVATKRVAGNLFHRPKIPWQISSSFFFFLNEFLPRRISPIGLLRINSFLWRSFDHNQILSISFLGFQSRSLVRIGFWNFSSESRFSLSAKH